MPRFDHVALQDEQMNKLLAAILAGTSAAPGATPEELLKRYSETLGRLIGRFKEPAKQD